MRSLQICSLAAGAVAVILIVRRAASRRCSVRVAPSDARGPVAKFVTDRDESVMGITVRVENLEKTQALLGERTHADMPVQKGPYGRSIIVSSDLAKGAWIEFADGKR